MRGNTILHLISENIFFFSGLFLFLCLSSISGYAQEPNKLVIENVHRIIPVKKKMLGKRIVDTSFSKAVTLLNDDFESDNFEHIWTVLPGQSDVYWGKISGYYGLSPQHSIWCAGGGGNLHPMSDNYASGMITRVVSIPFLLNERNWAKLHFSYWLETEPYQDILSCLVSVDGKNFYGIGFSGTTHEQWEQYIFDLRNVYILGDVTNADRIWIVFEFVSNDNNNYRGAFIDDIKLEAATTAVLLVENIFPFPGIYGGGTAWDGNNLWFSDIADGKVFSVDSLFQIFANYNSPLPNPADLAWDGERLWIADTSSKLANLQILPHPSLKRMNSFPLKKPYGLAFWQEKIFISDLEESSKLYTLQENSFDSISVEALNSSIFTGLASEYSSIWATDSLNSLLYKFIEKNDSLICLSVFEVPGSPIGLSRDWQNLYYMSSDSIFQVIPPRLKVKLNEIKANGFPEIKAYASITDDNNSPITNLISDNFLISEDEISQIIDWVKPYGGGSPVAFALVLDYSGSMTNAIDDMEQAAKIFVDLKEDQDLAAIYKFRGIVWFVQDLTSDDNLLYAAIDSAYPYISRDTALYDAIDTAAVRLANISMRRAIIAITDGNDNGSKNVTYNEMIQHVKNFGIPVFMIGLGDSIKGNALQDIAQQTNGDYYFAPASDALDEIFTNIARRISNQYEIKYTTTNGALNSVVRTVELIVNYDYKSGHSRSYYIPAGPTPPQYPVFIWIDSLDAIAGDSISIPVNIFIEDEFVDPIYGLYLSIEYDSSIVLLDTLISNAALPGSFVYTNEGEHVLVSIAFQNNISQDDTLTLFNLVGTVTGSPGDIANLTFDSLLVNEGYPSAGSKDGIIRIRNEFSISGTVGYYNAFYSKLISDVNMKLIGISSFSATTNETGFYQFSNIPSLDFNLIAEKEIGRTMAVSSLDAALVLRNVVGLEALTEFQKVAGDVTHNCSLSPFDAALIQKYVIGILPDTTDIGKFFFVPKDSLPIRLADCHIPHSIQYSPLNSDLSHQDLKGYVLGDVSGNWTPGIISDNIPKQSDLECQIRAVEQDSTLLNLSINFSFTNEYVYSIQGKIKYLGDFLKVENISLFNKNSNLSLIFQKSDSDVAFSIISPIPIKPDDPILKLEFKKRQNFSKFASASFRITNFMINEESAPEKIVKINLSKNPLDVPLEFGLDPAYPNPFNSTTLIQYQVPIEAEIELSIYNIVGQRVKKLAHRVQKPGNYKIFWDGADDKKHSLPSGVYILSFKSRGVFFSSKLLLIR